MNIEKQTITLNSGRNRFIVVLMLLVNILTSNNRALAGTVLIKNSDLRHPRQENGIPCCYNVVLNALKLGRSKHIPKFSRHPLSQQYIIRNSDQQLRIYSKSGKPIVLHSATNEISKWNDLIDWTKVKYSFINTNKNSFLIAVAPIAGASGLETNFYEYLVVNLDNGWFQIDQSLSNDYRFFIVKSDRIEYYLFDYSKEFIKERDYDNISLTMHHWRLYEAEVKLIDFKTRNCNCIIR